MKGSPQIADAEWKVMKVLWGKSPLPLNNMVKQLKETTKWTSKTVQTLLTRLVKKGALSYEMGSRGYLYYPIVSESECIREETKSFLGKLHDGSLNLLVKRFLESNELTEEEIAELKRTLNGE